MHACILTYIHYIALHYMTWHHMTSHDITLHNITSHDITLHYNTLDYIDTSIHVSLIILSYILLNLYLKQSRNQLVTYVRTCMPNPCPCHCGLMAHAPNILSTLQKAQENPVTLAKAPGWNCPTLAGVRPNSGPWHHNVGHPSSDCKKASKIKWLSASVLWTTLCAWMDALHRSIFQIGWS